MVLAASRYVVDHLGSVRFLAARSSLLSPLSDTPLSGLLFRHSSLLSHLDDLYIFLLFSSSYLFVVSSSYADSQQKVVADELIKKSNPELSVLLHLLHAEKRK